VVPFFWLALIVFGLAFAEVGLKSIWLGPVAKFAGFLNFFASLLLVLVTIRIISELMVALFRSEATKSMRDNVGEMSETVQGKAKAATASVREKADDLTSKPKSSLEKVVEEKAAVKPAPKKRGRPAGSKNKPKTPAKPTVAKTTSKSTPPKKRGRPAGSKNKKPSTKPAAKKTATPGKRGPKPGTKVPRDADGNLLKKDGTPRKKPGPKKG